MMMMMMMLYSVKGSLKLCALESIFSEWIHWKCRSSILFSVKCSLKLWALRSIFS